MKSITYEMAKNAKMAAVEFSSSDASLRNQALQKISQNLIVHQKEILNANSQDVAAARKAKLSEAIIDRLLLNEKRIASLAEGVLQIAKQEEVVGQITHSWQRPDGLLIERQRVPLGVIAMIFESRPNVVVDAAALAIKSGNAILLKGGKEAHHSNKILSQIVRDSIRLFIPENVVQLIESREQIDELLQLNQFIDLMIPRGGDQLITHVYNNAKMPVVAHFKGICHGYIHDDADLKSAHAICINAKAQRPGVCNAMETLLLNKNLPQKFIVDLFIDLQKNGIELRVGPDLMSTLAGAPQTLLQNLKPATDIDWQTEYLDKILAVKQVADVHEAIQHIQTYGTHHTEFICTANEKVAHQFLTQVDASCVLINASSRFNDGGELGLGAEIGISTSKVHAYGPMGAREMTIERFLVRGSGHIRQ